MSSFGDKIEKPTTFAEQVLDLFGEHMRWDQAKVELKPCQHENAMEVRVYVDCIIDNATIVQLLSKVNN